MQNKDGSFAPDPGFVKPSIPATNRFVKAAGGYPETKPVETSSAVEPSPEPTAAVQEVRLVGVPAVQEVRLVGIGRFACWWFVILSMLGIVVGIIEYNIK
jgi:hypothetical protein